MASALPEVWLRGPLPNVPPLSQPIAHALLQASEEISAMMNDFPEELLWQRPAGVASVGFHLQHLTGVLDRLFTYAVGKPLDENQLRYLKMEGVESDQLTTGFLVNAFREQVQRSVQRLIEIGDKGLTDHRGVGRAGLPSTVIGLLTHAAEHTMRHTGQLLVTVKVLRNR
ncbi:DinB superfamily protein [Chryseolinea serpens]|uniref:DinB superfamily protein n=1 Tax=Chryseolinea serpens TaxID=947013 RepID=A0A1M5M780_9BACT|nr:DinB family protein [Chryseolinea serpens]SHG73136.1 DinB superfamily protein [Chryseolinea serpens]